MPKHLKAILTLAAAVLFAVSPFFITDFNGFDPGLYPNPQVDAPVQPAGYAFAIWGVIYLWLLVHAGFGVLRRGDAVDWDRTRGPLFVSLAVGALWLPVAMVSALWATALIIVMLVFSALALVRAPTRDRWWAAAPIALYTGWLTAASFASLGLVGAGFGVVFGQVPWAITAILGALVVTLIIRAARPDEWVYPVPVIWALIAIAVKNAGEVWLVAGVAAAGAALVTALMIQTMIRRSRGVATSAM